MLPLYHDSNAFTAREFVSAPLPFRGIFEIEKLISSPGIAEINRAATLDFLSRQNL